MKKTLQIALILCSSLSISAQNSKELSDFTGFHKAAEYATVKLKSGESALVILNQKIGIPSLSLVQKKELNSAAGKHTYLQIEKDNIPFYGLNALVHDYSDDLKTIQYPLLSSHFQGDFSSTVDLDLLKQDLEADSYQSIPVYWSNQSTNFKALRTDFKGNDGLHFVLISASDEILVLEDQRLYFQTNDSTCTALIFAPDPLSTANVNYGGSYVDNNDGSVAVLDAERKNITFKADYSNGTFNLENADLKISDFSSPSIAPYTQNTPTFNLTRDQDGFEDVNAFAHLSIFKKYIDSLGFSSIPGNQIEIDVHALSDADQSYFSGSELKIYMGEGGVDDAEDVDVVIHEYIHALVFGASPNSNRINERAGMEEAIGDYFAVSYSHKYTSNQSDRVFNWDGHNSSWPGREATSNKDYQAISFTGSIYTHTDLMTSCLREIMLNTSRATSDQIVLEALFSLQASTTYRDFALMILTADAHLNAGLNFGIIKDAFVRRNVLPADLGRSEIGSLKQIQIYNTHGFTRGENLLVSSNSELLSYQISNLEGKIMTEGILEGEEAQISGSTLKRGLYLLTIKSSNTNKITKILKH
jgi:hypothetical protein